MPIIKRRITLDEIKTMSYCNYDFLIEFDVPIKIDKVVLDIQTTEFYLPPEKLLLLNKILPRDYKLLVEVNGEDRIATIIKE